MIETLKEELNYIFNKHLARDEWFIEIFNKQHVGWNSSGEDLFEIRITQEIMMSKEYESKILQSTHYILTPTELENFAFFIKERPTELQIITELSEIWLRSTKKDNLST